MFTGKFKIIIAAVIFSAAASFSSFAAVKNSIPFNVEFDCDDDIERLCYAGHTGSTVKYKEGPAVLPDSYFSISSTGADSEADIRLLSADISLIYEKDDSTGSYKETIRTYDQGSLELGESYQLLSENTLASLNDRGLLYSDSLQGVVMTLNYNVREKKKQTIYLYICDDDDYSSYLESAQE